MFICLDGGRTRNQTVTNGGKLEKWRKRTALYCLRRYKRKYKHWDKKVSVLHSFISVKWIFSEETFKENATADDFFFFFLFNLYHR